MNKLIMITPPKFLLIQLKFFDFTDGVSRKINRTCMPLERFSLPMENDNTEPYTLEGIVQHEGVVMDAGHYVANIKKGENWYYVNDNEIVITEELLQQPYILLYKREDPISLPTVR